MPQLVCAHVSVCVRVCLFVHVSYDKATGRRCRSRSVRRALLPIESFAIRSHWSLAGVPVSGARSAGCAVKGRSTGLRPHSREGVEWPMALTAGNIPIQSSSSVGVDGCGVLACGCVGVGVGVLTSEAICATF